MAKTQAIRRRIRSVKNINQITKAMEMVAASKLRRVQTAALQSRLYASTARETLSLISQTSSLKEHPLFEKRPVQAELVILFTSDRGLAGAYNTNLFKNFVRHLTTNPSINRSVITIGQKGAQFVSRLKTNIITLGAYTGWPALPTVEHVRPIITTAKQMFLDKQVDRVTFMGTDFSSIAHQQVITRQLLPMAYEEYQSLLQGNSHPDMTIEPSPAILASYILPRFLEVQLYQAALEAAAAEQAMRMLSMHNASDNAKNLTADLTSLFNSARQTAITQELAEITAGAAAVN